MKFLKPRCSDTDIHISIFQHCQTRARDGKCHLIVNTTLYPAIDLTTSITIQHARDRRKSKKKTGLIVGMIVGIITGLLGIICLAVIGRICYRKHKSKAHYNASKSYSLDAVETECIEEEITTLDQGNDGKGVKYSILFTVMSLASPCGPLVVYY